METKTASQNISSLVGRLNRIAAAIPKEVVGFGERGSILGDITSDAACHIISKEDRPGSGKRGAFWVNEELWEKFWAGLSEEAVERMAATPEHVAELFENEPQAKMAQREASKLKAVVSETDAAAGQSGDEPKPKAAQALRV